MKISINNKKGAPIGCTPKHFLEKMFTEGKVKKCNWLKKISGLTFTRREKAEALLFEFPKGTRMAIHSWFVFFPFLAVWLDDKNKIMEKKIVNPFRFSVRPSKKYASLVEIPVNGKYKDVINFLDAGAKDLKRI